MSTLYDGKKVAVYKAPEKGEPHPRVTDFSFIGHAVEERVPYEMTFEEFLRLETKDKEQIYFGKRQRGGWVIVIRDPMTGTHCTYGRSPTHFIDIVP